MTAYTSCNPATGQVLFTRPFEADDQLIALPRTTRAQIKGA